MDWEKVIKDLEDRLGSHQKASEDYGLPTDMIYMLVIRTISEALKKGLGK
jgi:hypothetical protein